MTTTDPLDQAEIAALAESVSHTAHNEEQLVTVTSRPQGMLTEIRIAPSLHDLGAETAAAEILAVIKTAQEQADADFGQRIQTRLADAFPGFGGERA